MTEHEPLFAESIQGHRRVREVLGRVLRTHHVHPSLIISGPPGIGKRKLAFEFALALNCERRDETGSPLPCHSCSACRKGVAGNHPDLFQIEPADGRRTVSIAQVRGMIENMGLKPYEGRHRVFLLYESDGLAVDAMNTLLKTLEEPPGKTVTILLAERPHKLLATIHSRCQQHRLAPLSQSEVEAVLRAEGVDPAEAAERARFANGAPGRALNEDARCRAEEVRMLFEGLASGRAGRDAIGLAGEIQKSFEDGAKDGNTKRTRILELLDGVLRALRDLLIELKTGAPPAPPMAGHVGRELAALADRRIDGGVDTGAIRSAIEAVDKLQGDMIRNLHVALSIEGLVIDLAAALCPEPAGSAPSGRGRGRR